MYFCPGSRTCHESLTKSARLIAQRAFSASTTSSVGRAIGRRYDFPQRLLAQLGVIDGVLDTERRQIWVARNGLGSLAETTVDELLCRRDSRRRRMLFVLHDVGQRIYGFRPVCLGKCFDVRRNT